MGARKVIQRNEDSYESVTMVSLCTWETQVNGTVHTRELSHPRSKTAGIYIQFPIQLKPAAGAGGWKWQVLIPWHF